MRYIIITENSVYTAVENGDKSVWVTGRATFDASGWLPGNHEYVGQSFGLPKVGDRFRFNDPDLGPVNTSPVREVIIR